MNKFSFPDVVAFHQNPSNWMFQQQRKYGQHPVSPSPCVVIVNNKWCLCPRTVGSVAALRRVISHWLFVCESVGGHACIRSPWTGTSAGPSQSSHVCCRPGGRTRRTCRRPPRRPRPPPSPCPAGPALCRPRSCGGGRARGPA